jgi:ribosomal protein L12E/L44/L45/RPP1/RPP2
MLGVDASDDLIRDVSIHEPVSEADAYPEYQDDLASILKTAGVPAQERPAPDYEDELSEADLDNLISAQQIATAQADLDAQSKAQAQQLATAQANAPKGPLYHPTPDAGHQDFRDPKNAWRIPGTPAAKDMGSVVPANANLLPKPTGSSGGGSIGKDLKGLQQNIAKENAIGQAAGTMAGAILAPTVPGSPVVGGIIGDKLGDALTSND